MLTYSRFELPPEAENYPRLFRMVAFCFWFWEWSTFPYFLLTGRPYLARVGAHFFARFAFGKMV